MPSSDFVIIGAGIIGLTTAFELKKRFPKASIAVLENEPALSAADADKVELLATVNDFLGKTWKL